MNPKKRKRFLAIGLGVVLGAGIIVASTVNSQQKCATTKKGCCVGKAASGCCGKKATVTKRDPWAFLPDVLARVGDRKITKAEFVKEVVPMLPKMPGNAQLPEQYLKKVAPKMVEGLVDKTILLQLAEKAGIKPSPELIVNEFDKSYKALSDKEREQFSQRLKAQNMDLVQYRKKISSDQNTQEGLAITNWITRTIAGRINVSNKDVRAYYDQHPKMFQRPEMITASHILIKPEAETAAAKAAARKKAEKILAELKKDGSRFGELATAESACPSGKMAQGRLGTFARGQMVKEFEDAAFKLKPNELSNVVETKYGYHIIKVSAKKEAGVVPYDEAKEFIKQQLTGQKVEETLKGILTKEKTRLKVKINV